MSTINLRSGAAFLRRLRHIDARPSSWLGKRWQGTVSKPDSFENMLSQMDLDHTGPDATPQRRPRASRPELRGTAPSKDGQLKSRPERGGNAPSQDSQPRSRPEPKGSAPSKDGKPRQARSRTPNGHQHGPVHADLPLPRPMETTDTGLQDGKSSYKRPPGMVKLQFANGWESYYDEIFLRDSCTCPQCVDPSTSQKRFNTIDIPRVIRAKTVTRNPHDFTFTWEHDIDGYGPDHVTKLSNNFLQKALSKRPVPTYRPGKYGWHADDLRYKMVDFDYEQYMSDDRVLLQLLRQLHVFGLVFIKNVPELESSVIDTANRIGPLKNTFYGNTWNVRSVSNAKNVAYTDVDLGFHMDLLYMIQPPRLQLLHCLRASTHGGLSLFSDSYAAVWKLFKDDKKAFGTLVNTDTNFHYDNDNNHYFQSRPTIQLAEDLTKEIEHPGQLFAKIEAVNWSPPFQAPFSGFAKHAYKFAEGVREWHKAAQSFRDLIEAKSAVYKRQMAPGECVIFDNRRVLHARTAFSGGERWLRGTYLDDDPFLSKCRVLEKQFPAEEDFELWVKPQPPHRS